MVDSSECVKSLANQPFIIFDNSNQACFLNHNYQYCQKHQITYLTKKTNIGNSKAYNYLFDYLKENLKPKWLILADSDTKFGSDYLNYLSQLDDQYDFYLPQVYSKQQQKIVFPIQKSKNKIAIGNKALSNVIKLESINSGLILSKKIYYQYRYNEKCFCYCSDFLFIQSLLAAGLKYKIIDACIYQDFFDHQAEYNDDVLKRMIIRLHDEKQALPYPAFIKFRIGYIWDKFLVYKKIAILKLLFIVY